MGSGSALDTAVVASDRDGQRITHRVHDGVAGDAQSPDQAHPLKQERVVKVDD